MIFDRCVMTTKISSLASLLLLFKVNTAVPSNPNFFDQSGKNVIYVCFNAVTVDYVNDTEKMPREFKNEMERLHGTRCWPSKKCLGNSLNYFCDQYITNLQTNLNYHGEKLLTRFIRMRCFIRNRARPNEIPYDGIDIRNIMKDIMKDEDWTDGDAVRQQKKHIYGKISSVLASHRTPI